MRLRPAVMALPAAAIGRVLTGNDASISRLRELTVEVGQRKPSAMGTRTICNLGPAWLTRWILASGISGRALVPLSRRPIVLAANIALSNQPLILEHDVLRRQRTENE